MKKILLEILVNLIGGIIGVGLVLGFFYLLGLVVEVLECHLWLMIPLTIYVFYLILKEI